MILVVAVVVLLGVMAYPSIQSMQGDLRLRQAADQVRSAWAMGRVQAVNEGRPYRFSVIPNKGNYRLAPDSSDFWSGNLPDMSGNQSERPVVLEAALPKGVRLTTADAPPAEFDATDETSLPLGQVDPGMYLPVVTFLPDGTSREDVAIIFSSKGTLPIVVKLRGITGGVTVRPFDPTGSGQ